MPDGLEIRLRNGTPAEARMRDVLSRLLARYDLAGWLFTNLVEVDENAFPHSHPVLTLNTAYERDETSALAELVHEQLHWFEEQNVESRDRAVRETALRYASVPSARPEGAGDEGSTRLHLLVCYLEYQALKSLIGGPAAQDAIAALSRHHYRWVYRTVLRDEQAIGEIVRRHGLLPAPLRSDTA